MRYLIPIAFALGALLLSAAAFAGGIPDPSADPGWYLDAVRQAVAAKAWAPLLGLAVLVVAAVLRWQRVGLVSRVPWLATRAGGWCLNIGLALLGAVGPGLYAGAGWRDVLRAVVQAGWAAAVAAGVLEAVKDKLAPRAP